MFNKIAIVGVGLLGGSIGLACKERELCGEIIGIGRKQIGLDEAVRFLAIDRGVTDLEAGIADADLVILCTPVLHIISILETVMRAAKPGAMITDVGSTKRSIVDAADAAASENGALFVGSHPMAGSEKSGVRNSRADLYVGSTCFVTKSAKTDLAAFAKVCAFWRALDARLVVTRPERHDRLVALVSHLPHLVAVALLRAVDSSHEDKNLIKGIIGNGFRDTTRIAGGSTDMWDDICADNTGEIEKTHAEFMASLQDLVSQCKMKPSLREILEEAAEYRRFLDAGK